MCGSTSRRFSAKVVLGILRNRGYLGEVSLRRTPSTRRRPHRPRSVRQGANVLAERGESYDRRFTDKHPEYLLTGLISCGRCQRNYVGAAARGKGHRYRYYTCWTRQRYGTDACDGERIRADVLEAAIFDADSPCTPTPTSSPPSPSSPPCCSQPRTSARPAPGGPSPPATRPAPPPPPAAATPACATTSQTADSPQHPPPPLTTTTQPGGSHATDRQNAATWLPEPGNRSRTAARADVRPHGHNQKQSPTQFCRYDTGSSVGNPW